MSLEVVVIGNIGVNEVHDVNRVNARAEEHRDQAEIFAGPSWVDCGDYFAG